MTELAELQQWWMDQAEHEIELTGPKAVEYGSYDLELIGAVLADLLGWKDQTVAIQQELGCWFYALGKIARMASAYKEHRLPSDDTPFDLRVYAGMIQRIREAGSWPGKLSDQAVACGGQFEERQVVLTRLGPDGQPDGSPPTVSTTRCRVSPVTEVPEWFRKLMAEHEQQEQQRFESGAAGVIQVDPMNRKLKLSKDYPGFDSTAQANGYSQMWMAENGIGWEDMKRSAERGVRATSQPVVLHKHDIRTQCPGVDVMSIDESSASSCYTMRQDRTKKQ